CASGTLISQGRGGRGAAPPGTQKVTAVRAGRIVDPDTGTAAANQVILIEGDRITNVGANLPIPQGAEVIDLSSLTILPGHADTALRQAIEQGWMPGPTIIPSGLIISTTGGQFTPSPEMYKFHNIVYPEYLEANSRDEIVKAVRENLLFGAKVIKICLDCKPWGYSVDDIKLFISEAAKGGAKVNAHVQ